MSDYFLMSDGGGGLSALTSELSAVSHQCPLQSACLLSFSLSCHQLDWMFFLVLHSQELLRIGVLNPPTFCALSSLCASKTGADCIRLVVISVCLFVIALFEFSC